MQQSDLNDEYLKPLSENLTSGNKEVILLDDFNTDLLKCDSIKDISNFLDIIYFTNVLPNITSATSFTSWSQTLIDNIFSSIISDRHAQLLIIPDYKTTKNSKNDIYKQNFKHFHSKKNITDLEKVN